MRVGHAGRTKELVLAAAVVAAAGMQPLQPVVYEFKPCPVDPILPYVKPDLKTGRGRCKGRVKGFKPKGMPKFKPGCNTPGSKYER